MFKSKLMVALVAVTLVIAGTTTVYATGNHHEYGDCKQDEEVTELWSQNEKSDKEYKGKEDHSSSRHKKPHYKKCDEKPKCEYNQQLPKDSPDCVKPEEPTQPEVPTVPEQPVQPAPPVTPQVTPAAATTTVEENPTVVSPTDCLKSC